MGLLGPRVPAPSAGLGGARLRAAPSGSGKDEQPGARVATRVQGACSSRLPLARGLRFSRTHSAPSTPRRRGRCFSFILCSFKHGKISLALSVRKKTTHVTDDQASRETTKTPTPSRAGHQSSTNTPRAPRLGSCGAPGGGTRGTHPQASHVRVWGQWAAGGAGRERHGQSSSGERGVGTLGGLVGGACPSPTPTPGLSLNRALGHGLASRHPPLSSPLGTVRTLLHVSKPFPTTVVGPAQCSGGPTPRISLGLQPVPVINTTAWRLPASVRHIPRALPPSPADTMLCVEPRCRHRWESLGSDESLRSYDSHPYVGNHSASLQLNRRKRSRSRTENTASHETVLCETVPTRVQIMFRVKVKKSSPGCELSQKSL